MHLQVPFIEAARVPPPRLAEPLHRSFLLETKGQDGGRTSYTRHAQVCQICLIVPIPLPPSSIWQLAPRVPPFLNRFCLTPRTKKPAAHCASEYVCLRRVCQPVPPTPPAVSSFVVVVVLVWVSTICLAAGKVPRARAKSR